MDARGVRGRWSAGTAGHGSPRGEHPEDRKASPWTARASTCYRWRKPAQKRARLAAGPAWQDNDLIFCQADGGPIPPDRLTNTLKAIASNAGLPVIRLHDGRHTAASLGLEAGLDIKIASDQLGHATTRITQDLYTHVRRQVHDDAAERIVSLLPERKDRESEPGS